MIGAERITTYIGTYTRRESFVDGKAEGIYIYHLDLSSGALTYAATVSGPGTIADAPTLLWRLMLRGADPALLPWHELVAVAGPMAATPSFRYGDWHVAFALAGGGSESLLVEMEAALIEHSGGRPQAPVTPTR